MDYKTKSDLIGALAAEMNTVSADDLHIETSNYILDTNAVDCTALGLSMDTLEKTKNVIEIHERKFAGSKDAQAHQYLLHLRVAKKCVEEVMSQKLKGE